MTEKRLQQSFILFSVAPKRRPFEGENGVEEQACQPPSWLEQPVTLRGISRSFGGRQCTEKGLLNDEIILARQLEEVAPYQLLFREKACSFQRLQGFCRPVANIDAAVPLLPEPTCFVPKPCTWDKYPAVEGNITAKVIDKGRGGVAYIPGRIPFPVTAFPISGVQFSLHMI